MAGDAPDDEAAGGDAGRLDEKEDAGVFPDPEGGGHEGEDGGEVEGEGAVVVEGVVEELATQGVPHRLAEHDDVGGLEVEDGVLAEGEPGDGGEEGEGEGGYGEGFFAVCGGGLLLHVVCFVACL